MYYRDKFYIFNKKNKMEHYKTFIKHLENLEFEQDLNFDLEESSCLDYLNGENYGSNTLITNSKTSQELCFYYSDEYIETKEDLTGECYGYADLKVTEENYNYYINLKFRDIVVNDEAIELTEEQKRELSLKFCKIFARVNDWNINKVELI